MMRKWTLRLVVPAFAFAACCIVFGTAHVAKATVMCDPSLAGPGPYGCKDGGPNGVCQQSEQCDDGNTINGDKCDNNCTKPACGNGITDSGLPYLEECDDGNTVNNDSCDNNCLLVVCGDGRIEGDEKCDDGNTFNNDGCDSDPASPPPAVLCQGSGCGNGIVNMTEMMADPNGGCDDGNTVSGDGCSSTCKVEFCGDGVSNDAPNETCDDGNTVSNDGCSATCVHEFCGDGTTQSGIAETCDDGNTVSNDGCSSTCKTEVCGDGIKQTNEVCDDGNTVSTDNCRGDCQKDQSDSCGDAVTDGNEACDNGACTCVAPKKASDGRSCADQAGRDACAADGGTCTNEVTLAECGLVAGDGNTDLPGACRGDCDLPACGDGITDPGESCDDGFIGTAPSPADDTDSCPNGPMAIAMGLECNMTNVCGDGLPNNGHPGDPGYDPNACDNGEGTNPKTCAKMPSVACSTNADCVGTGPCGNSDTVQGCHSSTFSDADCPNGSATACQCEPDFCGDAITNVGETCDDGGTVAADCNPANGNDCTGQDICSSTCALATCGDGVTEAGEACDNGMANNGHNGNGAPGLDCTSKCAFNTCGDGEALNNEPCDDGNLNNADDCLNSCSLASCGDGVTRTSGSPILEQCDDGNDPNKVDELDALDGCSTHCCYEPTVALQTVAQMMASQQCNLDHLAQEIAALPVNRTSNRLKRHIAKALKLAAQASAPGASSKTICTAEKRKDRVTVCEQRAIDLGLVRGTINAQTHNELTQKILNIHGWVQNIRNALFCP